MSIRKFKIHVNLRNYPRQSASTYRIGIDARFYGPRGKGLGRYVQRLVDNLQNFQFSIFNFQLKFIIFIRKENWDEFQPQNSNFKKVLADYKWYGFLEQILFPIKIWRHKIDLMHFLHFNVPVFCPCNFIVTIHDLILRKFPTKRGNFHSIIYSLKEPFYKFVIWRAIKKSKKIIAVSKFTKDDMLNNFNVSDDKIDVIYEGAPLKTINSEPLTMNIKDPHILYVGNAYPHKNLERLIEAFDILNQEARIKNQGVKLILVGEIDYFYKKLQKFARDSRFKIHDSIIFTDFVSDQELNSLYGNAFLYVFPSLYEGFGLPSLEAMAKGVPVLSSDQTALPEILGEAALYFNPYSIEDMAEKIKRALEDESLRKELVKRGFERIKKYDWRKMGEETMRAYKEILELEIKRKKHKDIKISN